MNEIVEILDKLVNAGIDVYLEGDKLKVKALKGVLNQEHLVLLKAHKPQIIKYLFTQNSKRHNQYPPLHAVTGPSANVPSSFSQQRLLFIDKLEEGSAHYNVSYSLKLMGMLNHDAVSQALSKIIDRHESLRTCFEIGDDALFFQYTQKNTHFSVKFTDLSDLVPEECMVKTAEISRRESGQKFNLSKDLLLRAQLIKIADNEHILLLSMHHITSDAWTRSILVDEFSILYKAFSLGREDPLPALGIQYKDYACWQRNMLQGDLLEQGLTYWNEVLSGANPLHSLPLDKPRRNKKSYQGKRFRQLISSDMLAEINEFCSQYDVTLFMFLETCFALMVCRFSRQDHIVIGCPISGRIDKQLENLIGFFINHLALRTNCEHGQTFLDLLTNNKASIIDAYQYQHIPFDLIVDHLNPERNLSYDPIFQIVFGFNNFDAAEIDLPGLTVTPIVEEQISAVADLEIVINHAGDGLRVDWVYASQLFDDKNIENMAHSFLTLVSSALQQPNGDIESLSFLPEEQKQLVSQWGGGATVISMSEQYYLSQFLHWAEKTPDRKAVSTVGTELTFGALALKARCLAGYLQDMGIGQGCRVGIYLPRGIEQLIAILGSNLCGASYVALEPGLPAERLEYIVQDSALEMIILPSMLSNRLQLSKVDFLIMDEALSADWLSDYHGDELPEISLDEEAYVLYTSGSTGVPKGVPVNHANLNHYLDFAQQEYCRSYIDSAIVSSPLCFDATLTVLLAPLCAGKAIHLLSDGDRALEELPDYLFGSQENLLFKLTPAHLKALVESAHFYPTSQHQHILVVGGEQWGAASLAKWKHDLLPGSDFINEYGPTETVVGCSIYRTGPNTPMRPGGISVPIGKPISNTQLYVLSQALQLQPIGSIGELYIGGGGVVQGYLNREEQNQDSFIDYHGQRLYRTGDLVRWLPDGELEFVSRMDNQVKIRGFRIELGEIESQLHKQEGIDSAVVMAKPGADSHFLVAYIKPNDKVMDEGDFNEPVFFTSVKQQIAESLPTYMLPQVFVLVREWPLNVNGKLDSKRLPEIDGVSAEVYVAPRNELEAKICDIWAHVINLERVGIHDNFFSIGGDSILSIRIVSLLKEQGFYIKIQDIFQSQTIAELALLIDNVIPVEELDSVNRYELLTQDEKDTVSDDYDDVYPMSALQAGMVFHTKLEGSKGVYHDIIGERVKCEWHKQHFTTALQLCIESHPILRTGYQLDGVRSLQHVHKKVKLPLHVEDIRHLASDEQLLRLHDWRTNQALYDFDWSKGPLFQIHIFLTSEAEFEFVISFHHSVLDGWSRATLTTELYGYYRQLLSGDIPVPHKQDWTYRQYIALELASLNNEDIKAHFIRELEDIPGEQIPKNTMNDTAVELSRHQMLNVVLSKNVSLSLIQVARELGVGLQSVLLAAHFKVLSTFSGQRNALTCITTNGRPEQSGAEKSLGLFLNSLPLAIELKQQHWREFILTISDKLTKMMSCRHYPLMQIQRDTGSDFSEVTFNYTHFHVYKDMLGDTEDSIAALGSSGMEYTNFDLSVDISRNSVDDVLSISFTYNSLKYDAARIEKMASYFQTAFNMIPQAMDASCVDASLLSAKESHYLLETLNDTCVDYDADLCIHELFEQQVQQQPDKVALVLEGEQFSYGELNQRANQLAHYLIEKHQLLPDTLIGICLDRTFEMVIGILAILKAGGAYVPLDPDYPRERLEFMAQDSGLELLITKQAFQGLLSFEEANTVLLDLTNQGQDFSAYPQTNPVKARLGLTSSHLAYIIYTSGSTGQPKGVMIEHRALHHSTQNRFQVYPDIQSFLLMSSMSFDSSVAGLFSTLCGGGRLCLIRDLKNIDVVKLIELLAEFNVSHFLTVPSYYAVILLAIEQISLPDLQVVIIAGEACSKALVENHHSLLNQVQLYNEYGPTEAAVWCSFAKLLPGEPVSIGKPIKNSQLYILDPHLQLVPEETVGELYIGGDGLARGYLHQLELTAERFINNPYYDKDKKNTSQYLYKTGDLVRYLPNGNIAFISRIDDQVKIRGFRIEPGEIEYQLNQLDNVNSALVLAKKTGTGTSHLVAYIKLALTREMSVGVEGANAEIDINALLTVVKQELGAKLPDYMVPSAFVVLEEWPLTPNGKLDKKALSEVDDLLMHNEYLAAVTDTEKVLVAIWSELLEIAEDKISAGAVFFELGGHSLLITRLRTEINSRLKLSLELKTIIELPNLRVMAQHIDRSVLLHNQVEETQDAEVEEWI